MLLPLKRALVIANIHFVGSQTESRKPDDKANVYPDMQPEQGKRL